MIKVYYQSFIITNSWDNGTNLKKSKKKKKPTCNQTVAFSFRDVCLLLISEWMEYWYYFSRLLSHVFEKSLKGECIIKYVPFTDLYSMFLHKFYTYLYLSGRNPNHILHGRSNKCYRISTLWNLLVQPTNY